MASTSERYQSAFTFAKERVVAEVSNASTVLGETYNELEFVVHAHRVERIQTVLSQTLTRLTRTMNDLEKDGQKLEEVEPQDGKKAQQLVFEAEDLLTQMNAEITHCHDRERDRKEAAEEEKEAEEKRREHELRVKELDIEKARTESEGRSRISSASDSPSRSQSSVTTMKLPKYQLPQFDGDILAYQSFIQSFTAAVHNNQYISDVEKFIQLRSLLKGQAAQDVMGLDPSAENYEGALKLLESRYGRKKTVISHWYSKLNNVPIASNSTAKLRSSLSQICMAVQSLKSNGEDTNHHSLLYNVQNKFPLEVINQLEYQRKAKGEQADWNLDEFLAELQEHVSDREAKEYRREGSSVEKSFGTQSPKSGGFDSSPQPRWKSFPSKPSGGTAQSLLAPAMTRCVFCERKHWSDECQTFPTLEVRKKKLRELKRCFKCLTPNHEAAECRRKPRECWHCKQTGIHHRCICPKQFSASSERKESPKKAEKSDTSLSATAFGRSPENTSAPLDQHEVLFQMATVTIQGPDDGKSVTTRGVFDSASSRSYITADLARRLQLKAIEEDVLHIYGFGATQAMTKKSPKVQVTLKLKNGKSKTITANVVERIIAGIQRAKISPKQLRKWTHLKLADSMPDGKEAKVSFSIGNDYF